MRQTEYSLLHEIIERWSPRAFSPDPVPVEDVRAVVDAARQAPSCFNEQPWRFMAAHDPEALEVFRGLLNEKNRRWAGNAPVLFLVLAQREFTQGGKPNRWHGFDTGTAWGFLSLEAQRRGLVTHAMAGFNRDMAREALGIPEAFEPMAMVAMGRYGDAEALEPEFRDREFPADRKPLSEILLSYDCFRK